MGRFRDDDDGARDEDDDGDDSFGGCLGDVVWLLGAPNPFLEVAAADDDDEEEYDDVVDVDEDD